jgi:imidazolonepropionase-like amidohydrolase
MRKTLCALVIASALISVLDGADWRGTGDVSTPVEALGSVAGGTALAQARPTVVALVGGRVYPSPTATPLNDVTVLIEGGRIISVGPRAKVRVPPTARIIDCRNKVIVAGFQNSHVHFTEPHWAGAATQPAASLTAQLERMLTRYGFTTVVDTGSFLPDTTALRRRIESGEVAGPRILTAGLPMYPPEGIPFYLKDGSIPADLLRQLPQPMTAADAVRDVTRNFEGGADIVKLFTGSWVERGRVLPMPADIAIAAVREAHRRRALVFAHTSSPSGLEVTLAAGVDVIAHALDDTKGLTRDHLLRMQQSRIALVPTLTLFAGTQNGPAIFQEVADYAALSGDILFGTDVGYHQTYDTRLEYASLAKAGLDWRQTLAALTTTAARRFGEGGQRGQVAEGMAGDLVVLGADPLDGIQAFANVHFTVRSGQIIYEAQPAP